MVDPRLSPPEVVVAVKALACELPSRLGVPLARLHVPDIAAKVVARGIVAEISGTTLAMAVGGCHPAVAEAVLDLPP